MRRAVFLDRDGVINRNIVRNGRGYAPVALEDFEILPGVPEAVGRLRDAGLMIVVATNQPDVSTGLQTPTVLDQMHDILRRQVPVDDIEVCFHTEGENCDCRKPKPGMLLRSARKYDIDLSQSWMVGDRWRDIDAGAAAGCRTVFVDYNYPQERRPTRPDLVVGSLVEAVPLILAALPKSS
ncbi:HAD-IIIA family hydrolase [Pseudolabrys sp. FHR47]|uniref:D-glycero-alpha-D-manno-heptose-1,7-bisphosphate 7-phosphatase n=1 Tax=Pseudolabrys sp. FHR47 TaxID=2562284 RepID=UPI0010BEE9A2|nr:HAD family hydrolase [Pseudolabrys sp. FHR47]